jgi:hypothetical protein
MPHDDKGAAPKPAAHGAHTAHTAHGAHTAHTAHTEHGAHTAHTTHTAHTAHTAHGHAAHGEDKEERKGGHAHGHDHHDHGHKHGHDHHEGHGHGHHEGHGHGHHGHDDHDHDECCEVGGHCVHIHVHVHLDGGHGTCHHDHDHDDHDDHDEHGHHDHHGHHHDHGDGEEHVHDAETEDASVVSFERVYSVVPPEGVKAELVTASLELFMTQLAALLRANKYMIGHIKGYVTYAEDNALGLSIVRKKVNRAATGYRPDAVVKGFKLALTNIVFTVHEPELARLVELGLGIALPPTFVLAEEPAE